MNEKVSPLPPFKSEKPFLDPNSLNEYKGDWSACCCPHIWTMTSVLLMFARIDSTNGSVNFSTSEIKIGNNYLKDVPVQVSRTIFPTRIGNCVLLSLAGWWKEQMLTIESETDISPLWSLVGSIINLNQGKPCSAPISLCSSRVGSLFEKKRAASLFQVVGLKRASPAW